MEVFQREFETWTIIEPYFDFAAKSNGQLGRNGDRRARCMRIVSRRTEFSAQFSSDNV